MVGRSNAEVNMSNSASVDRLMQCQILCNCTRFEYTQLRAFHHYKWNYNSVQWNTDTPSLCVDLTNANLVKIGITSNVQVLFSCNNAFFLILTWHPTTPSLRVLCFRSSCPNFVHNSYHYPFSILIWFHCWKVRYIHMEQILSFIKYDHYFDFLILICR